MARFTSIIAIAVFVVAATANARAQKKSANVNYDDPNMAFTSDYAADQAATCPKTLKGRKLRECLVKNGLATSEEVTDGAELLTAAPPTSFH